jgi:hypothetical protein
LVSLTYYISTLAAINILSTLKFRAVPIQNLLIIQYSTVQ